MFSKQHYEAIAKTLAKDANLTEGTIGLFVALFVNDNERFQEQRFRKYLKKFQGED